MEKRPTDAWHRLLALAKLHGAGDTRRLEKLAL